MAIPCLCSRRDGARIVKSTGPATGVWAAIPECVRVYALPPMSSPSRPSVSCFKGVDVGPDVVRGAQGLGLVEVAGEADLVAGLDAGSD